MARLTIIVPVYNVEKYLAATLDSLVNQTYKELEIMVINDGTKDNSQAIIDDYVLRYPQIKAYKKENGGIADTRNFALQRVDTEYFGFLDSDDTASFAMYEKMVSKADETDAQVVVSNFNWVYDSQPSRVEKEGPYQGGKEMMVHLFATLWNKIYRTSFIRECNLSFPTGYRYEDACFLYCLAPLVKKIEFVDEAFVNYYQRQGSITHNNNQNVQHMCHVFKVIQEEFKKRGFEKEYHDELEYIHIKFFLGNSFLRSAQIKNSKVRKETIHMGWDLLNESYPNWHKNKYLKTMPGLKHRYYRTVRKYNVDFYAWLFHLLKR